MLLDQLADACVTESVETRQQRADFVFLFSRFDQIFERIKADHASVLLLCDLSFLLWSHPLFPHLHGCGRLNRLGFGTTSVELD